MEKWLHKKEHYKVDYSGILGYVLKDSSSDGVLFYQLYKQDCDNHLCTTSEVERENAKADGYRDEGPIGWVYPGSVC